MGRGRPGTGVEPRESSIRVSFTWNGERCRETLELLPTPPNVKYAIRLVTDINRAIARGTFVYADFFPKSRRAGEKRSGMSVQDAGDKWLRTKGRLASATLSQYRGALKLWYRELGAAKLMSEISATDLEALVGGYKWSSPKRCNNALIALRGLTGIAHRDGATAIDLAANIEDTKQQTPLPDPFTLEEAEAILESMQKRYPPQIANYFEAAFFGGFRPEEEIALQWVDIDWPMKTVRIQRARSFRGELKDVKNYQARDVELPDRVLIVLQRQKEHTFMKRHTEDGVSFVFENPVTRRPFHDERSQRDNYWTPTLKRLGIRYRRPYNTRHTYATALIMAGCNPSWLARQMGNSPRVIFKHYAKWIDAADRNRQRGIQDAAFTRLKPQQFVLNLSPADDLSGRRDWDRTKPTGGSTGTDGNGG